MIVALIIVVVLLLASLCVLRRRRHRAIETARRWVNVAYVLAEARGRSIVIGEHHADREGLQVTLALISRAHDAGYRTLGVEMCEEGRGKYRGLHDEIAFIGERLDEDLDERDELTYLDGIPDNDKPRFNRHWQIQAALRLGWKVVSIDPHHWNHLREDECGYIHSREPAMAEAIRGRGPMIAVIGYGHLSGLNRLLGGDCMMVASSKVIPAESGLAPFWIKPIRFAATLPRLNA